MPEESRQSMQLALLIAFHALVIVVFIWDVWMMATSHDSDTVSAILKDWSRRYPELLIPVGYLLCHLFGR